ncbi:2224_t:CDS:1, partial [Funneliformis geosporum]
MNINNSPCKVKDCDKNDPKKYKFRKFTQSSKAKTIKTNAYQNYSYLQIDNQLCFSHYLTIVEADRNKNKKRKLEEFNEINIRNDDDYTE